MLIPVAQRSVSAPDRTICFGRISEAVATALDVPEGEIRLLRGFEGSKAGFGLEHFKAKPKRLKALKGLGYRTVELYVFDVASDFDKIASGKDGKLILLKEKTDDTGSIYWLNLVVVWREAEGYWSVTTGLPMRVANKPIIYEVLRIGRSEPQPNSAESPRLATLSLPNIKSAGKES